MARQKGTANLAASLEVLAGAPLDSRTVVPTVADLTVAANFPYKYIGMPVVVQATGDMYVLTANDVTVSANWKKQSSSGGSGGHTIEDNGTAMTARSGLNFTDFDISDDSTNDETDVKAHRLTQEEMADIIYKTPSVDYSQQSVEANIFDTNEKVIGQWTDGKLLYQKVITGNTNADSSAVKVLETLSNLDTAFIPCAYVVSNYQVNGIGKSWGNIDSAKSIGDLYVNTSDGKVTFYTINQNFFNKPIVVVLRYTKTTESALASDEKYAGLTASGEVIYKKHYTSDSEWVIYANSFTDTNISASNVEKCIDCKGYDNNGSSITGFLVNTYGKGSRYTTFNVCGYRANNAAVGITEFDFYYTKKTS